MDAKVELGTVFVAMPFDGFKDVLSIIETVCTERHLNPILMARTGAPAR